MAYFNYQSKKIYYTEKGKGMPVVFLHGNTASSRMFELILPLYEEQFRVILIDFLGNGRSDRLDEFPVDLWQEQARQTIALLEHLQCGKANLVGCSGGAWAAVNAGLLRPDLIAKVVVDSFDGRTLADDFAANLLKEREQAKKDAQAAGFYQWCQGEDWEQVVDMDTRALIQCASQKCSLFWKPLSELSVPLILLGSLEDEMTRSDLQKEYEEIAKETGAMIHMFSNGGHPAILSNAEEAAKIIHQFLKKDSLCEDIRFLTDRALWETENLIKCIPEELWAKRYDGIPMWKYLYHTLYSMDRWYINPCDPAYQNPEFHMETLADLNVVPGDEAVTRDQMERYFAYIKKKIENYITFLRDKDLAQEPESCSLSRFRLILGQFRHWHRHMGIIYGFLVADTGKWPYVLNMDAPYPEGPMPNYYL